MLRGGTYSVEQLSTGKQNFADAMLRGVQARSARTLAGLQAQALSGFPAFSGLGVILNPGQTTEGSQIVSEVGTALNQQGQDAISFWQAFTGQSSSIANSQAAMAIAEANVNAQAIQAQSQQRIIYVIAAVGGVALLVTLLK